MGRYPDDRLRLTAAEISRSFVGKWGDEFPPVLTIEQAAALAQVSKKTLYDWRHRGLLKGCSYRVGKRLRIHRDRFMKLLFGD